MRLRLHCTKKAGFTVHKRQFFLKEQLGVVYITLACVHLNLNFSLTWRSGIDYNRTEYTLKARHYLPLACENGEARASVCPYDLLWIPLTITAL